jgi:hypothetical protein
LGVNLQVSGRDFALRQLGDVGCNPPRLVAVGAFMPPTMQMLVSLTDTSSPAKWSMLRFSF